MLQDKAHLDKLEAKGSQGQLSERGEGEDGRMNGIADGIVEAGDLQALQILQQGQRAQIPCHHCI